MYRNRPHKRPNARIEDPPSHRLGKHRRQQPRTKAERVEKYKTRADSPHPKNKAVVVLGRNRPQQNHCIKVNVRIEPSQRKAGQNRRHQGAGCASSLQACAPTPRGQKALASIHRQKARTSQSHDDFQTWHSI